MRFKLLILALFPILVSGQFDNNLGSGKSGFGKFGTGKGFGQKTGYDIPVPLASLNFYWDGGIRSTDSTLLNRVTGTYNTNFKLLSFDGSLDSNYLSTKSTTLLKVYGDTVPVTCLFQNYNYADTLFFKKDAHTIASDSTEIYPQRISEIAYYSSEVSSADSTTLWSYFSVPRLATNGYAFVGNNEGDSSSIQAAITAASVGDTIYIRSGIWLENVATYGGILINKNNLALIGIGDAELRATGTYPIAISTNSGNINIENLYVNGSNKSYMTRVYGGGDSIKYQNCKLIGADYVFYWVTANNVILDAKNSYIGGYSRYWGKMDFTECYFTPLGENYALEIRNDKVYNFYWNEIKKFGLAFFVPYTAHTINFKYNKTKELIIVYPQPITFNSKGNHYVQEVQKKIFNTTSASPSVYNFHNDYFDQTYADASYINLLNVSDLNMDSCTFNVNGSIVFSGGTATSDFNLNYNNSNNEKNLLISLREIDSLDFSYNNIYGNSFNLEIYNTTQETSYGLIAYNRIVSSSDSTANVAIQIGKDGTGTDGYNNNYTVLGNYIYQKKSHANIGIFKNYNQTIKYNYIREGSIGILFKGDGQKFRSVASYNIIDATLARQSGIYAKGADSVFVYNNTINIPTPNPVVVIIDNEDVSDYSSDSCRVFNNLVHSGNGINLEIGDDSYNNLFSDYNLFYSTKEDNILLLPSTDYTFLEWQGLGFDVNSYNTEPNLTNNIPIAPSDAIDGGVDLGVTYDDGLDISTDFTTTPPTIVTKQQGTLWEIGAYVTNDE